MTKLTHSVLMILFIIQAAASDQPITSITLSPHLTELVFSAGGKQSLIGISAYSNYPEESKDIAIIGDAFRLDYELIKALQPDVVFYWKDGTANQVIQQLEKLNFKLQEINITQLSDIPKAIVQISQTLNTTPLESPDLFIQRLELLKAKASTSKTALIQISDKPIYTVNGEHWMSEAIGICGLKNVFAELKPLSAAVTLESVILNKPEVIITTGQYDNNALIQWPNIPAVKNNLIIQLNADTFTRPTLRILIAIDHLCQAVSTD